MVSRDGRILQFEADWPPRSGENVQVLCEDHCGTYILPFLCNWAQDSGWTNAITGDGVVAEVLGWREAPLEQKRKGRACEALPAPRSSGPQATCLGAAARSGQNVSAGAVYLQGEAATGGVPVEVLGEALDADILTTQAIDVRIISTSERPSRSSFHTTSTSSRRKKARGTVELRPLGADLTRHPLLKGALAAGLGQRVALQVQVLVKGRDTGIADRHFSRCLNSISPTIDMQTRCPA